jgi:uncharacterized delta-60 repeat protein
VTREGANRRIATRTWIAALAVIFALASSAKPAVADFDSFLVPGTRAPVVIADPAFVLTGLRPDGSLNRNFGRDGTAQAPFPGVADLRADDAATQADGRIVVSGSVSKGTAAGGYSRYVAVARFRASGRPDHDFGDDGVVLAHRGGRSSVIAPQRDGGLLVGGTMGRKPMLLRLRPDGSLDRRFGDGGVLVMRLRAGPSYPWLFEGSVTDLVRRPGGGAVVAVQGSFGAGRDEVSMLLRYGVEGRLDRRFGTGGRVALNWGFGIGKAALDLPGIGPGVFSLAAHDGRIVALAATSTSPSRVALVELFSDGRLDRGYGHDGVALGPFAPSNGFDLCFALESDGGAVVAVPEPRTQFPSFFLSRFTPAGGLRQFGGPGGGETPAVTGSGPYSLIVRPNGDILVLSFDVDPPYAPLVARFRFEGGSLGIWPAPGQ